MDILAFLKRKGMTQSDLAKVLKVSGANVNKWVSGKGYPSYEMCRKLIKLGITCEELFGEPYKGGVEEIKYTSEELYSAAENVLKDLFGKIIQR